ncbi:MAG TPA: GNAT family N-acetyltransferase, partial [Bacteroidia bacterium]|nr:GNAT family N-acetyltransferase [Bacteroidia bacterium]
MKAHPDFAPVVYEWYDEGGDLRALIPMFRSDDVLEMAAGPHVDFQDVAAIDGEAAVEALSEILAVEGAETGRFIFPKVVAQSRLGEALADPRLALTSVQESRFFSLCPVATLDLEPEGDFTYAIPARQRKDYRNAARRISEQFPEHGVEHLGPGHFDPSLLDEAAMLHSENQYRKKGESVCDDPAFVAFLKGLAVSGAPLCLSILREREDGPLLAFHLGYFERDTFFYYLTSYSERAAQCSPGRWLLVDALRHWAGRTEGGRLRFDMLC